jgi:hypothetical protein
MFFGLVIRRRRRRRGRGYAHAILPPGVAAMIDDGLLVVAFFFHAVSTYPSAVRAYGASLSYD